MGASKLWEGSIGLYDVFLFMRIELEGFFRAQPHTLPSLSDLSEDTRAICVSLCSGFEEKVKKGDLSLPTESQFNMMFHTGMVKATV